MKKYYTYTAYIFIIIAILGAVFFFRSPKKQKEWIEHQLSEMKSFSQDMLPLLITTNGLPSTRNILDEYEEHYFEFQSGDWVYLRVHSFHTDNYWQNFGNEKENSFSVGDISIAFDNNGNFYKSKEHVCGGFYDEFSQGYDFGTNFTIIPIEQTNFMSDINHFLGLWPWKEIKKSQPVGRLYGDNVRF